MSGNPAQTPQTQEARGGQPRSKANPRWARIVNPVQNGSQLIRRKDADRLVSAGRAEWIAGDQLRLVMSHPTNRANAAEAATHYIRATKVMVHSVAELRHIPVQKPQEALIDRSVTVGRRFRGRSGQIGRAHV